MMEVIQWGPGVTLHQIELMVVEKAFQHFKENKTQTATALDISIRSLDDKLEKIRVLNAEEAARTEERRIRDEEFLLRARGITLPEQTLDRSKEVDPMKRASENVQAEMPAPVSIAKEAPKVLPKDAHRATAGGRR